MEHFYGCALALNDHFFLQIWGNLGYDISDYAIIGYSSSFVYPMNSFILSLGCIPEFIDIEAMLSFLPYYYRNVVFPQVCP